MAKIICPECGMQVKKCKECEQVFDEGVGITCIGQRGKHFCQYECFESYVFNQFNNTHTVVDTYTEKDSK